MLARAGLSCVRYGMYVYRYYSACGLWRSRAVGSVCCWLVLVCFSACVMRALLPVVIWCTRVIMRCNRFPVLGGVVLPCALSCDCGAFYKCLSCCRLMV